MNRYAIEIREPRKGETIINQGQVIEMPVDGTVPMAVVVDGSDRWHGEVQGAVLHGRARGGRDGTPCHQRGGGMTAIVPVAGVRRGCVPKPHCPHGSGRGTEGERAMSERIDHAAEAREWIDAAVAAKAIQGSVS